MRMLIIAIVVGVVMTIASLGLFSTDDCAGLFRDKSYKEAIPLCQSEADGGNIQSTYLLGRMYYKGWGVIKDYDTAYKLLTTAATNGNVYAMVMMDEIFFYGNGTQRNLPLAYVNLLIAKTLLEEMGGNMTLLFEKQREGEGTLLQKVSQNIVAVEARLSQDKIKYCQERAKLLYDNIKAYGVMLPSDA